MRNILFAALFLLALYWAWLVPLAHRRDVEPDADPYLSSYPCTDPAFLADDDLDFFERQYRDQLCRALEEMKARSPSLRPWIVRAVCSGNPRCPLIYQ